MYYDSSFYIQSLRDKNIIRQSQINENEIKTDNSTDTIIEDNELNSSTIQAENKEAYEVIDTEKVDIIDRDTIFRTGMFDKFLLLEQQLIKDNYLNENLNWIAKHDTTKRIDIKSLIIFLVGLLDNRYFLPGKDPKIKLFIENRYNIKIGQNFERSRRTALYGQYKITFLDYPF